MPVTPEDAYALAAAEYDGGTTRPGLLAQAEAEADGDPARVRATYLRLRARQILSPPEAPRAPQPMPAAPVGAPDKEGLSPAAWVGIIAATLVVAALIAFLVVGGGGGEEDSEILAMEEGATEPEQQPRPVIADVSCESGRQRVRMDPSDLAGSIGSAVGSLRDKPSVDMAVTVRNSGFAGDVVVAVVAYSDREDGEVHRTETVSLEAGEQRTLTYQFDPVPFSRGAQCQAWAVLPSESLDAFDRVVAAHRPRPQPARETPPAAPEPADDPDPPQPILDPEPERPRRPDVATPPITSDPVPRTPPTGDGEDTYEPVPID